MKKIFTLSLITFLFLPAFSYAQTANMSDVIINEIAWMGSKTSANDEWIELKNTTDQDINLTGWTLTSNGSLKITLKGFIEAQGFFLMERTDDNSVPDIPADMLYTGALSNTGQSLTLSDTSHTIINQINFSKHWPAGNNTTKQTMEKTATGWQSSKNSGGTPKMVNKTVAVKVIQPPPTTIPQPTPTEPLPSTKKTDNTYLSALSESIKPDNSNVLSNTLDDQNSSNPWFLFLIALGISMFAAITILLLKLKVFRKLNI